MIGTLVPADRHVSAVPTRHAQKLIPYYECQTSGTVISYLSASRAFPVSPSLSMPLFLCHGAQHCVLGLIKYLSYQQQLVLFLSILARKIVTPKLTSFEGGGSQER